MTKNVKNTAQVSLSICVCVCVCVNKKGKGDRLKQGEIRVMLFLAFSVGAIDTALSVCVRWGEKKGGKNLLCVCVYVCVCVCVRVRERDVKNPVWCV